MMSKQLIYKANHENILSSDKIPSLSIEDIRDILLEINKGIVWGTTMPPYVKYEIRDFMKGNGLFEKIMSKVKSFNSIEDLRIAYGMKINNEEITRGSINGYIKKLKKISLLETMVNPKTKIEKIIKITYLGIAFVLNYLFNKYLQERGDKQ